MAGIIQIQWLELLRYSGWNYTDTVTGVTQVQWLELFGYSGWNYSTQRQWLELSDIKGCQYWDYKCGTTIEISNIEAHCVPRTSEVVHVSSSRCTCRIAGARVI